MITSIGGQAVMEGVMMQGPHKTALAVRMPDNTVSTEEIAVNRLRNRYSLLRLPILRGVAGFIDALSVGYKALSISAEKSGLEDDEQPSKFDQWMQRVFGDKLWGCSSGCPPGCSTWARPTCGAPALPSGAPCSRAF